MMELNLQHLLLESMEEKQNRSYRKLVYLGGKCFVLAFRLTGKTLILDAIKTREIAKKESSIERFHKRLRNLRRRQLKDRPVESPSTMERSSSCSLLSAAENKNSCTQTEIKEHYSRGTFTSKLVQKMLKKTRDTQTKPSYSERDFKITQTQSRITASIGIECIRHVFHSSTQTESLPCRDISTQYEGRSFSASTQTDGPTEEYNKIEVDEETVVFMLNEIGEISTINRELAEKNNKVSMNTFELLGKIVNAQKLQLRILQPLTKWDPMLGMSKSLFSEATQTEITHDDKETQTKKKPPSFWKCPT